MDTASLGYLANDPFRLPSNKLILVNVMQGSHLSKLPIEAISAACAPATNRAPGILDRSASDRRGGSGASELEHGAGRPAATTAGISSVASRTVCSPRPKKNPATRAG